MKGKVGRQEAYEDYGKWVALQMKSLSNFIETHDTGELEWVVENTKCRVCRIHAKTALVLYREGYEELAMRNLEFAGEALKSMMDKTEKEVKDGIGSDQEEKV